MADSNTHTRDDLVMYMHPGGREYSIIDIVPGLVFDSQYGHNTYNKARGLPLQKSDKNLYIYWSQERMEGHGWTRKK